MQPGGNCNELKNVNFYSGWDDWICGSWSAGGLSGWGTDCCHSRWSAPQTRHDQVQRGRHLLVGAQIISSQLACPANPAWPWPGTKGTPLVVFFRWGARNSVLQINSGILFYFGSFSIKCCLIGVRNYEHEYIFWLIINTLVALRWARRR